MRSIRTALLSIAALVPGIALAQGRAAGPALDDAAVAGIFDVANTWDIATGALAANRAARQEIRDFGAMLARDHKVVQQQARDLAAKLGVTPTPVPADFPLKTAHETTIRRLQDLSGAAFDRAFLEHEVAFHKAVIDAVSSTLLPAVTNAELKAFVQKVAPAFHGHMLAAEALLRKQ